jgi:Uma2 family endonuclease
MTVAADKTVEKTEKKAWTDEEFMALPDDGNRYEIVNGELMVMANSGMEHGYLAIQVLLCL